MSSRRGNRRFQRPGLGFKRVMHLLVPLDNLSMSSVDESVYNGASILFLNSKVYFEYYV